MRSVLHATDPRSKITGTYNAELLDMLNPQLERALEERRAQSSISELVKWILKRLLAGSPGRRYRPWRAGRVERSDLALPELITTAQPSGSCF